MILLQYSLGVSRGLLLGQPALRKAVTRPFDGMKRRTSALVTDGRACDNVSDHAFYLHTLERESRSFVFKTPCSHSCASTFPVLLEVAAAVERHARGTLGPLGRSRWSRRERATRSHRHGPSLALARGDDYDVALKGGHHRQDAARSKRPHNPSTPARRRCAYRAILRARPSHR